MKFLGIFAIVLLLAATDQAKGDPDRSEWRYGYCSVTVANTFYYSGVFYDKDTPWGLPLSTKISRMEALAKQFRDHVLEHYSLKAEEVSGIAGCGTNLPKDAADHNLEKELKNESKRVADSVLVVFTPQ